MRIAHADLLRGTLADAANSYTSEGYYLGSIINYAMQAVFTGSPAGTVKIQVSCDIGNPNAAFPHSDDTVVNWVDLSGATATISAAGTVLMNLTDAGYSWARVVWTPIAGSGNISVLQLNMKGM
jgi:hypothetical protein